MALLSRLHRWLAMCSVAFHLANRIRLFRNERLQLVIQLDGEEDRLMTT